MFAWSTRSAIRLAALAVLSVGSASLYAVPITGTVNISGAVGVGATTIDFQLPIGGPDGGFSVDATGNTGSFAGLGGTTGRILDLNVFTQPVGTSFLLPGFITFASAPTIRFDLTYIQPGVFSSASCFAAPAAGQTCTPPPFGNGTPNPFNLFNTTSSSSVAGIQVQGFAVNTATGESSPFVGTFSTQFPTLSYQQLLSTVQAGGTVNTSYSASFNATIVPEPSAMVLLGSGLIGLAMIRRRRSN